MLMRGLSIILKSSRAKTELDGGLRLLTHKKIPLAHSSESDSAIAPIPFDQIQHILENGPNDNGHGFGPIQIESINLAPPPSHLKPMDEAKPQDPHRVSPP